MTIVLFQQRRGGALVALVGCLVLAGVMQASSQTSFWHAGWLLEDVIIAGLLAPVVFPLAVWLSTISAHHRRATGVDTGAVFVRLLQLAGVSAASVRAWAVAVEEASGGVSFALAVGRRRRAVVGWIEGCNADTVRAHLRAGFGTAPSYDHRFGLRRDRVLVGVAAGTSVGFAVLAAESAYAMTHPNAQSLGVWFAGLLFLADWVPLIAVAAWRVALAISPDSGVHLQGSELRCDVGVLDVIIGGEPLKATERDIRLVRACVWLRRWGIDLRLAGDRTGRLRVDRWRLWHPHGLCDEEARALVAHLSAAAVGTER